MGKRKKTDSETDTACLRNGVQVVDKLHTSTIVTGCKFKNQKCAQAFSDVHRVIVEVMTLATKLGSLFILEQIANKQPMHDMYIDQTFWRWCVDMVTLKEGKPMTDPKPKKYSRKGSTPKRKDNENEQCYQDRLIRHVTQFAEKQKRTSDDKNSVKPLLLDCWNRLKKQIDMSLHLD